MQTPCHTDISCKANIDVYWYTRTRCESSTLSVLRNNLLNLSKYGSPLAADLATSTFAFQKQSTQLSTTWLVVPCRPTLSF